jgi:N-acetylmuramoyl-L-alanine amidase
MGRVDKFFTGVFSDRLFWSWLVALSAMRLTVRLGVPLMTSLLFLAAAVQPWAGGAQNGAPNGTGDGAGAAPVAIPAPPEKTPEDAPRYDAPQYGGTGCKPDKFRIALDVGHTPEAPGATSARGVKEHVFNLQLARRIQNVLADGGFVRTSLITAHGIGHFQLVRRIEQANASRADLLLSIHHDDVQDGYHQTWTHDGATHVYSDRYSGYSLFVSRDNRHFDDSLMFARLLGNELAGQGLRYSAHHAEQIRGEGRQLVDERAGVYRYDGLFVLRSSASPAVLLEAGIIVNRKDELMLASPARQDQVGAAVLAAVNAFCR